jgi:hypothetical protein
MSDNILQQLGDELDFIGRHSGFDYMMAHQKYNELKKVA